MLPRFFHRSRREAMEVAAAILPAEAAPRREVVTAVRSAAAVATAEEVKPAPFPARVELPVQPAELQLCRVHNDLAARRALGDDWMDRFTRKRAEGEPVGHGPA